MEGKIISIYEMVDQFNNRTHQLVIQVNKIPTLYLGKVVISQKQIVIQPKPVADKMPQESNLKKTNFEEVAKVEPPNKW